MTLDPAACYRALRTRDARFDGRFVTAVRSTGIYCRPICPARTPREENCLFLPHPAAAQELGYRPCLRCRPEASPGTPAWLGTSATVSRALRLICDGALDEGSVDDLAARLGVGERQLRRLFVKHLGAAPVAVAQNRRVLFAKKLLDETALPMAQVAFASGFASVRRFNHAMRDAYGMSPRELRRGGRAPRDHKGDVEIVLPYRPPLDWDALARFFAPRATPGVEAADGKAYRRTITANGVDGIVEVRPDGDRNHLVARIRLPSPSALIQIAERLRGLFDLGADPRDIGARLRRDPRLRRRVDAAPGLRVPGAWDGFELAVRAILGQQVTVKGATLLAGRLVERFGRELSEDVSRDGFEDLERVFPPPEILADADVARIGLPRARARAISALSKAVADGELDLDSPASFEDTAGRLAALPGIGPWTVQYVAMRALREPDAFPTSDLGLRRALTRRGVTPTAREIEALAESWRPWRSYAAMYLWLVP